MAWEDRIQRLAKRPQLAGFSDAKDRYRARTRGGYPRKFRNLRRGLGSFENQMMADRLRGPVGMNFQPQTRGKLGGGRLEGLLKMFSDNLLPLTPPGIARTIGKFGSRTAEDFLTRKGKGEEEIETPRNLIPVPNEDTTVLNLGDTGYFNSPYYELGSGIVYEAPDGGTIYNPEGFDAGDILRPVEKRIFPMNIERGPFGDTGYGGDVQYGQNYPDWYENPFGYNRGGIVSLRR